MFRRIPRVKQRDITDCGVACLLSVALHYGKRASLARLRQHASTDTGGTNVLGLVEAADRLGFSAKGVRAKPESLAGIPLPAIAHLRLDNGLLHYCVLYRIRKRDVIIMDPADGQTVTMTSIDFQRQWTGVLVLVVPSETFVPGREGTATWSRLWHLVRPHGPVLLQALLGAVIYTLLGLSTAIYVRLVVDHVLTGGNMSLMNLLGVGMVLALGLQVYFGTVKGMLALRIGQRIDASLMLSYQRHVLRLPQRFHDTMRVGETISRLSDAVKIRGLISEAALEIAVNVLTVVLSLALMMVYSWRLTLIVAAAIPLYASVLAIANHINRRHLRAAMERAADLETQLIESVGAVATVKQFALEQKMEARIERRVVRLLDPIFQAGRGSIFTAQASEAVSRASVIVLFWIGASFVARGHLTPGELLGLYALLAYMTGPMARLLGSNRMVQDALIAADRLFEVLDLEREESDDGPGVAADPGLPSGDIRFKDVTFRYGNRGYALHQFDLRLRRGEMTALVGPSGGGKSTVLALLQKLYSPESGRVMIGDVDLRHLDPARLRASMVTVPQEPQFLSTSVLDNIAMGDDQPDPARAAEVCREVGIHEFIDSLPAGYATVLGEQGGGLSGGQRQRLAIARALYRKPRVLLLDEATSNLDPAAEHAVEKCLERLRDQRVTIVMIAHRLDAAATADRIAVIDDGQVVEEGTHEDLLVRNGTYSTMWSCRYGAHSPAHGAEPLAVTAAGADLS